MTYYQREEQETLFNYDPIDGHWIIYSTYPPDIRNILKRAKDIRKTVTGESGNVIEVHAVVERNKIRLYT